LGPHRNAEPFPQSIKRRREVGKERKEKGKHHSAKNPTRGGVFKLWACDVESDPLMLARMVQVWDRKRKKNAQS